MHLSCLNLADLLVNVWRGTIQGSKDDPKTWPFAVLSDKDEWAAHGLEVERAKPYLPGFFDRAPRNIADKFNSGYKAIECEIYLYNYSPNLMRRRLGRPYWDHLCKTVRAMRNLKAYTIPCPALVRAKLLLTEATKDFETHYYARDPDRLHLVRPVIHTLGHTPDQVVLHGSLICLTQLPMERLIGDLGAEIKQPSKPYANLSQRAVRRCQVNALKAMLPELDRSRHPDALPRGAEDLGDRYALLRALERSRYHLPTLEAQALFDYLSLREPHMVQNVSRANFHAHLHRWARLRLPNQQVARSAWKECEKPLTKLRMARCIKFETNGRLDVGEVRYFAQVGPQQRPVALVSVFGPMDAALFEDSFETIELMPYRGDTALKVIDVKSIKAVVGMIPDLVVGDDAWRGDYKHLHVGQDYFVVEKLGFEVDITMGSVDPEMDVDE
ncbi:hypothetical protein LXA43DRAFT_957563 [Ganoderma leucocontextum]|nr:hypothetical protein LXA43DRAFT_957563 [Ganoderma leucocontextum]